MYLTFEEYQNMGGTLDQTSFSDMEFEAECLVNWYTFNRLHGDAEYPDPLKRCVKALIDLIQAKSSVLDVTGADGQGAVGQVASQSNDGVSVSYNILSATDLITNADKEIGMKIQMYLQGVTNSLGQKLLYRGVYANE